MANAVEPPEGGDEEVTGPKILSKKEKEKLKKEREKVCIGLQIPLCFLIVLACRPKRKFKQQRRKLQEEALYPRLRQKKLRRRKSARVKRVIQKVVHL